MQSPAPAARMFRSGFLSAVRQPWSGRSARMPAALVLLVYSIWLAAMFASGHDVRDFIHMGQRFAFASGSRPLITRDPHYRYAVKTDGYDGQFSYYIALAPIEARLHLDRVNYRYTRILYPMLARTVSIGQAALIPYMLIAINMLALAAGAYVLALWLGRKGLSPLLALVYGLSPGLFICLHRDLEEPLAYALVALALYLYSFERRHRLVWSGLAFALAALTRESTALFPIVLGLCLLFDRSARHLPLRYRKRWSPPAIFAALALGPFMVYKAFLSFWLGSSALGFPPDLYPQVVPFGGILADWQWNPSILEVVAAVIAPALICAGMGIWTIRKRDAPPEVWLLLANIQLFVVMLNPLTFRTSIASTRVTTGVVLAALLCVPIFDRRTGHNRAWLWISIALWFIPWPTFLPS
jgi:hypothetical protein